MTKLTIRTATTLDAAAIQKIYQPYVEETAISFEYEAPDAAEMTHRIQTYSNKYPYIIAFDEKQKAVGFAYATPYSSRAAYEPSCEVSIYVAQDSKARGIGQQLYDVLEYQLTIQGRRNLVAIITASNKASLNFFEKNQYKQVGYLPRIGYKFDQWHDVIYLIKSFLPE
ncbi:GNAT family N-acetyltransferase [Fundicoccus culcitae]|uniref:GNAT family N-acetyltransferase n=1 Tax=Fundicoccus culcitae TaxID=2969821 RepID=A0ABY5P6V7_9LACT|nr:GNAT family N-acetyltransferase [Fundicoccus culcitae]UUX34466.1 GNAT family N-acetyltransferase [Fundicoccus culcitae]